MEQHLLSLYNPREYESEDRLDLQLIPIVRIQVTFLRLLIIRHANIWRLVPVLVLCVYRNKVDYARCCTQAYEADADRIALVKESFGISCRKAVRCNDASDVAEADLPCRANSTTVVPTKIHRKPANDD